VFTERQSEKGRIKLKDRFKPSEKTNDLKQRLRHLQLASTLSKNQVQIRSQHLDYFADCVAIILALFFITGC